MKVVCGFCRYCTKCDITALFYLTARIWLYEINGCAVDLLMFLAAIQGL